MYRLSASLLFITVLLGCKEEAQEVTPPKLTPEPEVVSYQGKLFIQTRQITGDVQCNGESIGTGGTFSFTSDISDLQCDFGGVVLGTFDFEPPAKIEGRSESAIHFDLSTILGKHADNAMHLLNKIDSCPTQSSQFCLDEINSVDIQPYYGSDDQSAIEQFLNPKPVSVEEGKRPTTHTDPLLKPTVTSGASSNLGDSFVAANAEAAYEYIPSKENRVLTRGKLTTSEGKPVAGVNYFSQSAKGVTDSSGEFEYLWGEELIFGIDTFTLGQVKGNKVTYSLANLNSNKTVQQNLEALFKRYGDSDGEVVTVSERVHHVFAKYPNVVNELINLRLPNGSPIEGSQIQTPNEFDEQFGQGLTRLIDNELKRPLRVRFSAYAAPVERKAVPDEGRYVTESLRRIYRDVDALHVFHDNQSWGASGWARAMRNLNLTNAAFPVLMLRNDNNYWLKFGEEAAWSRGNGTDKKAFFVDAATLDKSSLVTMQRPPVISKQNATFSLPTMAAGMIGQGKVVFLGNAMYTSVLSCPDNYWANKQLSIDPQKMKCLYRLSDGKDSSSAQQQDARNDGGSMHTFFRNLIDWLVPQYSNGSQPISVATNISKGHAFYTGRKEGRIYDFFVDSSYQLEDVTQIGSSQFNSLRPDTTPLLLLQSYDVKVSGYETKSVISDVSKPKLSKEDITALINYVDAGGNIIFFDALEQSNPEPIARLADAAGVSVGGANQARTLQSYCGESFWCHDSSGINQPNLHALGELDLVVYERYADTSNMGISSDGSVSWPEPGSVDMPELEIPRYEVEVNGKKQSVYAFHFVSDELEKRKAINEIQQHFKGVPECKDPYQYEVNCIELRSGHGIPSQGNYNRPDFTRYPMSMEVVDSMVTAANLGANLDKLLSHELYYRSKGVIGHRLSKAELSSAYDNLSVWMWNDEQFQYKPNVQDELGFKRAVELLNCYTGNSHQGGRICPSQTRALLLQWAMLTSSGELNPSYPLNWMEKPLTRIMLGRSFWDLDIRVDTSAYPGRPSENSSVASVKIYTKGHAVVGTAGNMQSTGLWAPQLESVTVRGGVKASIIVALVDDLTGLAGHEMNLKRPPRVQKTFQYDGTQLTFKVPYGGLIYVQPIEESSENVASFQFEGVLRASWWKQGDWVNPLNLDVPLAEVDTGHLVYTTPVKNLQGTDLKRFATEMNAFANHASDFYGRDSDSEIGTHRRFTYDGLAEHRHRFVNDVQISVGAAHSGYPVQSSSFDTASDSIPTTPLDDWLLWHEVGHNLASAPFTMAGSTEVTNNILALYMQEQRMNKPYMERIEWDVKKVPYWLDRHDGHAWSEAGAGMRLAMFGQLKLWAEEHFRISKWYGAETRRPGVFGDDEGWNLFKLAHRKARGDSVGDLGINYCSQSDTGLTQGDLLAVCLSYLSGYDLTDYFKRWNPSETKAVLPNGESLYSGGVSTKALAALAAMQLSLDIKKPPKSPSEYISVK